MSEDLAARIAPPARPALGPLQVTERIAILDILRGFALFGTALVNIAPRADLQLWTGVIDRLAMWLIRFVAEGKAYPLFSFLFGLGFAIQMARAEARGASFGRLSGRRLSVLLLIGLAHAFLIWYGDILVLYAVLGFVLLLFFRKRSSKALLIWASICLLIPTVLYLVRFVFRQLRRSVPEAAAEIARASEGSGATFHTLGDQAIRAYGQGTFAEIMAQRANDVLLLYYATMPFFAPTVFAMFLLGLYAERRGIFRDASSSLPFLRNVLRWGLPVGLVGSTGYVIVSELGVRSQSLLTSLIGSLAFGVGGPALGLAYAAGLALLIHRSSAWQARLAPLAAAGRMALTNYLLQSIIATTVLYSYGLGMYGKMGPAAGLLLATGIYAAKVGLSVWWLRRFRFGPAEWLWRSLTYLRPEPMRLETWRRGPATNDPT